jgi:hypothetical protein
VLGNQCLWPFFVGSNLSKPSFFFEFLKKKIVLIKFGKTTKNFSFVYKNPAFFQIFFSQKSGKSSGFLKLFSVTLDSCFTNVHCAYSKTDFGTKNVCSVFKKNSRLSGLIFSETYKNQKRSSLINVMQTSIER